MLGLTLRYPKERRQRGMRKILSLLGMAILLQGCETTANVGTFSVSGMLSGSVMTRDTCDQADTSVWVTVDGRGECVRYFHAGLGERNNIVHVWLHGDRMWQSFSGGKRPLGYGNPSAAGQQRRADRAFRDLGVPHIHLSRPGTYGSSGFHQHRRLPRNVAIVRAAFDALKERYGIERFAISGQSGGGHLVAALLADRNDILCAVSTSGVIAVKQRNKARGWRTDITGYSDFYDPIDHVDRIPVDEERRIFIVGDPRDTNVPFKTQESYFKAVQGLGHRTWLVKARGTGREHHGLAHVGFRIIKWCVEGVPSEDIVERSSAAATASWKQSSGASSKFGWYAQPQREPQAATVATSSTRLPVAMTTP